MARAAKNEFTEELSRSEMRRVVIARVGGAEKFCKLLGISQSTLSRVINKDEDFNVSAALIASVAKKKGIPVSVFSRELERAATAIK